MVHRPGPIADQKLPDGISLGCTVPMSSLERNPLPTRGWRNRDAGCVGLAIAVALEEGAGERARKLHSTAPIMIGSQRNSPFVCLPDMSEFGAASCCASRRPPPAVSAEEFCVSDFLRSCHLCRKKLLGKDIFMYREKPFCSDECRHQQMMSDEYQEKYGTRTPKRSAAAEITSSPYSGGQLFFTGIAVS